LDRIDCYGQFFRTCRIAPLTHSIESTSVVDLVANKTSIWRELKKKEAIEGKIKSPTSISKGFIGTVNHIPWTGPRCCIARIVFGMFINNYL